jgi:hypothetical protein
MGAGELARRRPAWVDYNDSNTIAVVSYDDVNWYDDYDYVKDVLTTLERFIEIFDCDTSGEYRASYEFARTGEESKRH